MLREDKYFQSLGEEELWQRYCGFLDLSLDDFMNIQEDLLMEEIELVADSALGKKVMGGKKPASMEEFRKVVPLTTYEDYAPYIGNCQEDALATKPYFWAHTSGRGGDFKWVPYTRAAFEIITRHTIAAGLLASAETKGRVNLRPGVKLLLNVASPPYITGCMFHYMGDEFSFKAIPPLEQAEGMEFQERVEKGFGIALRDGVDCIFSISSVLAKIGEKSAQQTQKIKFSPFMLRPQVLSILVRAWLRSKRQRRGILPKDLWSSKAIITSGTDTAIYRDEIAYYWGTAPYEAYCSTEMAMSAIQGWDKEKGMYFLPDVALWEFIPEEERLKSREDSTYRPSTVLLNETEPGKRYEVVLTHFHGMPFLRYCIGDLVEIAAMGDTETGINLPQMVFQTRVDGVIHLASLTELDEKTIWQAITNTGIKYEDWSACKGYAENHTFLHLCLEVREDGTAEHVEDMVDEQLKLIDEDYRDLNSLLDLRPVKVTLLSQGTFQRYYEEKRKQGADLSHLKPPHIAQSDEVIEQLLRFSQPSPS